MGVLLVKLLSKIPLRVSYWTLSPLLYFLLYYVARYRVKTAKANILRVFPNKSDVERHKLLKDYYHFLADLFCEVLATPNIPLDEFNKRMVFKNYEIVNELNEQGKPIILLALHQCNWEWMLNTACMVFEPRVSVIYKPLHNKDFDDYFRESRSKFDPDLVPHKKAYQKFAYRDDAYFLVLLADQAPLKKREKVWSTMLDVDTAFPIGPQYFAQKSEAVVIYAHPVRVGRGYYEVHVEKLIEPPYVDGENAVLHAYAKRAGEAIKQQPETWLWSNRRWSYEKSEDPTLKAD